MWGMYRNLLVFHFWCFFFSHLFQPDFYNLSALLWDPEPCVFHLPGHSSVWNLMPHHAVELFPMSLLCFSLLVFQACVGRVMLSVVPVLCCFPSSAGYLDKWEENGKLPIVRQVKAFCWYWSILKNLNLDQISHPVYLKYNWVGSISDDW